MSRVSLGQLGNTGAPSAQVVEQEQPGSGLGGDDTDPGVGVGAGAGGRQRPDGVDELALVVDENRSGLGERGAGGTPGGGQSSGVGRGEGTDVVATDNERDDRLPGAEAPHRVDEPGPVGDGLDVQCDRARVGVGGEVVEDVRCGDVDGVPDADREADAVPGLGQQERQGVVDPAAGRDDGDPARSNLGGPGHEAGRHPGMGGEEATRVGPEQPDPGGGDDLREGRLVPDAAPARLGEPAAADHGGPGPGPCGVVQHRGAGRGRNADHGEIERACLGGGGQRRVHRLVAAVHQRQVAAARGEAAE